MPAKDSRWKFFSGLVRPLRRHSRLWALLPLILGCLVFGQPDRGHTGQIGATPFCSETFTFRDRHGSDLAISYLDTGGSDDRAIVLIHDFGASAYTWKAVLPSLAEHRRTIAVDLKGFGESEKPDDRHYSVFDQAEVVDGLISHLGLRDVILGGHSMGGTVALALASGPPDGRCYSVSRLILLATPAFRQRLPLLIMALDIPVLGEAALHIVPPATLVRLMLQASYYDDDLVESQEIEAYAGGLSSPGGRRALARTARGLADLSESGYAFDFDSIRMPVLIIWGKHDTVVPAGYAFALRDALPGPVSFHRLDKCGHIPHAEQPEEVLRLTREFLGAGP